jgi:hypothetical protein
MSSDAHAPALSAAVSSFQIGSRIWKIGDTIHSIGTKVIEKRKMVETFGAQFETGRAEGEFLGRGSGKKYRVKWTNLKDPYEFEYGAGHCLFKDPSKVRAQNQPKNVVQPVLAPDSAGPVVAVSNDNDAADLYPSDPEVSEDDDVIPPSAGVDSLNIGGNQWRVDSALNSIDPRASGLINVRDPQIKFPVSMRVPLIPSEVNCLDVFFHEDLFLRLVRYTNLTIVDDSAKVEAEDMRRFVGIMFAMTVTPLCNIMDYWKEEEDGLMLASRFRTKLYMSANRFKFIRQHFNTGDTGRGSKSFDAIRPIQDMFNSRALEIFRCGHRIVIDESKSGWHGKDEKRPDGPPALTHMIGKPESVSFMIKNLCCVESGVMFAIESQEGKVEMATRDFIRDGEKATTGCVLRLMSRVAGEGLVLHGDSWFASLNTLRKLHAKGNYFAGIVKTAHSGIPLKVLRNMFTAGSARGDTITVHLGDGADRIYAHAWNEPDWKNGKAPKKGQKVFIANCYTSAPVSTWDKPQTFLRADGSVGHGEVKMPQTHLIRE